MTDKEDSPDPQPRRGISEYLDSLSKAAVLVLFAIYFFGFLIVSIHNAEYGFTDMGLLRLKILTAGTLFLLLSAFPIALANSIFSHNLNLSPEQRFSRAMLASLSYLATCTVSGAILGPLYDYKSARMPVPTHRWTEWMAVVAVLGALSAFGWLMSFGWTHYDRHPLKIALCAGAFVGLWVAFLYFDSGKEIFPAAVLWLFGIGIWSELMRNILSDRSKREKFRVHEALVPIITALVLFPTVLYPRIKASWGGGSGVPVVVYFSRESRILPDQQLECDLLDESDNGIYIVKRGETKALFVPRSAFSALYFAEKPLAPEFLKAPPNSQGQSSESQKQP